MFMASAHSRCGSSCAYSIDIAFSRIVRFSRSMNPFDWDEWGGTSSLTICS